MRCLEGAGWALRAYVHQLQRSDVHRHAGAVSFRGASSVDRTSSLDTVNHVICGSVSSLSPFAIFQRTRPLLTALAPASIWLGLKTSDDVGTNFDVLVEVLVNGSVVGSGTINNVSGGSSGLTTPFNARSL